MIPWFEQPTFSIGPLTIHTFGILAAIGILTAGRLATSAARRYSEIDPAPLERAIPWAVIGGILGGHLLHVLGYHPELLAKHGPLALLRIWDGLSSMGGVLGGIAGFVIYFRARGLRLLPYLDALALGTAPGWAIARLGCFAAHDHPGVLTSFPLAVQFPGGARHDLGLYDAIVLALIAGVLYLVAKQRRPRGTLIALLALGYSVPRFFLDFLRARDVAGADARWLGLTPGQYVAIALAVAGIILWRSRHVAAPADDRPALDAPPDKSGERQQAHT